MAISMELERALRAAASWHRGQERRGSGTPYVQHAFAVAWILDRLGFPEEVLITGLLHDAVEDTEATQDQVREAFGEGVADLVAHCSEAKLDGRGRERPWIDRKREHLDALGSAPVEARAVILADKLHNLVSIRLDLLEGRPVWSTFHADREQVLWYYREAIARAGLGDDPRLDALAARCREALSAVEAPAGGGQIPRG